MSYASLRRVRYWMELGSKPVLRHDVGQKDKGRTEMSDYASFELLDTTRQCFAGVTNLAQLPKKENANPTYEELIAEACRLGDLKKTSGLTDSELKKEALCQMAESGLLDLSIQEIDLIFLKKTQPIPPPVLIVKSGFTLSDVLKTLVAILGVVIIGIIAIGFVALR